MQQSEAKAKVVASVRGGKMVSTWMDDHSSVEVDAVVKNTVKSEEWRNGASKINSRGKKKIVQFLAADQRFLLK